MKLSMNAIVGWKVRFEDFGNGFETWAIYRTVTDATTGIRSTEHVCDRTTEEQAWAWIEQSAAV
jgi:hypothetical protein